MSARTYAQSNRGRFLEELKTLIRIPSVSALPQHRGDVRRAADWLLDHLRELGFTSEIIPIEGGHPMVYAEWMKAAGFRSIEHYGDIPNSLPMASSTCGARSISSCEWSLSDNALLSARAGEEARIEGLSAGADDYLTKPVGHEELLATIVARLERKQTFDAHAREQVNHSRAVEPSAQEIEE